MEHQVEIRALDWLHPSLRETFVSLPGGEELLTPEQIDAIFGGDLHAIGDVCKPIWSVRPIVRPFSHVFIHINMYP